MNKKTLAMIIALMGIAILASVLTACNSINLDAPKNLKYNGSTISWNAVEHADYYLVQINDGEEKKVTSTSLAYDASATEFTVKITAVSDSKVKNKIGKSGVSQKVFKPLGKIDNVLFHPDGTAYWAAVGNATGYAVMLNGVVLDNIVSSAQFAITEAGQHIIQVKPVVSDDDDWYSVWSEAKTITKLNAPTNIVYDGEYIRWTAPASGAYGYEVYANDVKIEGVSGTSVKYDSQNVNFNVTVKSVGNHTTTYDSVLTSAKSFVYLSTVSTITVNDGIVNWPAVNGADGYIVKVDNAEYTVNTNSYQGLPTNVTKVVSVKPISNDSTYFSNFCVPKNIRLLPSPELTWISEHDAHDGAVVNSIQWQEVTGATGFKAKVTFNDVEVDLENQANLSGSARQFGLAFLETGVYKVYIKATANADDTYDSFYSNPVTITRLPAPTQKTENFIVSDVVNISEGFRVNFNNVSGATGYQLYKDGGLLLDSSGTVNQMHVTNILGSENVSSEQVFSYAIRSVGSVDGLNIKLDSLPVNDLTFSVTVQAMPTAVRMDGYTLKWGAITGAEYNVNVGGEINTSSANSRVLDFILPGTYSVSVNSRGNGSNILPSVFTAEFSLIRFSAPEDLYVTTDENDGILKYEDKNALADAYKNFEIWIDDVSVGSASVGTFANINPYISTNVSSIFVRITANIYDSSHPEGSDGAIYYMSSPGSQTLNLARLTPVSFPDAGPARFTNTQFLWNAPSNRNSNGLYSPSYIVYRGADNMTAYHNGQLNSTVMDISTLEGRLDAYDFVVKAIGDGTRYLNSLSSSVVSITKLQAPSVAIDSNAYAWNAVANASNYAVYIDGVKSMDGIHQAANRYSFIPNFTLIKSYQVKVVAVGDNGVTTIDSDACQFNQSTKKLANPNFTFSYSHSEVRADGTIDFNITTEAKMDNGMASTKGYVYSIGGATNSAEEKLGLTYSRSVSTPGTHSLSIRAIGGDFDGAVLGESFYYIASDVVGGGSSYQIIILGKLNEEQISLNQDKILSWTTITNAVAYEYEYVFDGETFTGFWTQTSGSSGRTIDLSSIAGSKVSVTIRVRAVGNGTTIISGDYTEKTIYF